MTSLIKFFSLCVLWKFLGHVRLGLTDLDEPVGSPSFTNNSDHQLEKYQFPGQKNMSQQFFFCYLIVLNCEILNLDIYKGSDFWLIRRTLI